jgi:hypothetical protein
VPQARISYGLLTQICVPGHGDRLIRLLLHFRNEVGTTSSGAAALDSRFDAVGTASCVVLDSRVDEVGTTSSIGLDAIRGTQVYNPLDKFETVGSGLGTPGKQSWHAVKPKGDFHDVKVGVEDVRQVTVTEIVVIGLRTIFGVGIGLI